MPTLTLTPAVAEAIANAVANGVPLETAARAAGIGSSTAYDWFDRAESGTWANGVKISPASLEKMRAFAARIEQARAQWEAKQIASITSAAQEVNEKTGQRDWRASAWLMNNHPSTRQIYHEHRQTTLIDQRSIPAVFHEVRSLPDDEIRSRLSRLSQLSAGSTREPAAETEEDRDPAPGLDRTGGG